MPTSISHHPRVPSIPTRRPSDLPRANTSTPSPPLRLNVVAPPSVKVSSAVPPCSVANPLKHTALPLAPGPHVPFPPQLLTASSPVSVPVPERLGMLLKRVETSAL